MIESDSSRSTHFLFSQFYLELRLIAQRLMLREKTGNTLSATALVNEGYLRIAPERGTEFVWHTREQFVATAAEAMRRTLVDRARAKMAKKRSATRRELSLESIRDEADLDLDWLLDVNEGLQQLAMQDSKVAKLVNLHLFAGLSIAEAGQIAGLSRWGSYQAWEFAKAWFAARTLDAECIEEAIA